MRSSLRRITRAVRGPLVGKRFSARGVMAFSGGSLLLSMNSTFFYLRSKAGCGEEDLLVVHHQETSVHRQDVGFLSQLYAKSSEGLAMLREALYILWRALYLSFVFSPAFVTFPAVLLFGSTSSIGSWWWQLARRCVCVSGPCTTKFCQWVATRPDLFPLQVCLHLQELQANAVRHNWRDTQKTLAAMFGPLWSDNILVHEYDRDSIKHTKGEVKVLGSGCVAQVVKATLSSPTSPLHGQIVAVKVIHPGVKTSIEEDLRIMRFLTWLVEACVPSARNMSLSESVDEFALLMRKQLDLRIEAASLVRFRKNFHIAPSNSSSGPPTKTHTVTFPEPCFPFVSEHALVETFEEGALISDMVASADSETCRELATTGLETILKMIFEDNFIHADLHTGNIIVRKFPSQKQAQQGRPKFQLAMIDAGIVAELSSSDRQNFVDLFKAVIQNDGKRVGSLMMERSRNKGGCLHPDKFEKELQEVVDEVHSSGLSLGRIGIAALLQRVLVACYHHQVKLEPKFVSVVLAIGVVEGLGRRLDPDVDILRRAAPWVVAAAARSVLNR